MNKICLLLPTYQLINLQGRNLDKPGTPNGKKRPQKKPQKSKKGKRGKQNQRRKSDGKDSTQKKGKGKKGRGRKGKTGKGGNGKKGNGGKPKRKDGALTSRQTGRRNIVQGQPRRTCRNGRAINETCVSNILAMYAIYANQMKNFEKQYKRIQAKNKTSNNKGGEKVISISNEQYAQSSYRVDRDQVRRARSTRRWRDLSSKEAATRAVSPVRFQHNHDHHHVRRIDHHAADELMVNGAVYQNDKKPFRLWVRSRL